MPGTLVYAPMQGERGLATLSLVARAVWDTIYPPPSNYKKERSRRVRWDLFVPYLLDACR